MSTDRGLFFDLLTEQFMAEVRTALVDLDADTTAEKVTVLQQLHIWVGEALKKEQRSLAVVGWRVVKIETRASCMVDETWVFLVPDTVTPEDLEDDPVGTLAQHRARLLYIDEEVDSEENRITVKITDPQED